MSADGHARSRRRRDRNRRRGRGTFLGLSGAAIVGSTVGSVVDSRLTSQLAPTQRIEGARLDSLRLTSSTEGAVLPRLYGCVRIGGNIISATDFREENLTSTQGGGKGGDPKVKRPSTCIMPPFVVALCERPSPASAASGPTAS